MSNKTYEIANSLLQENCKLDLTHLVLLTLKEFSDKTLYSEKELKQAWVENKKRLASEAWLKNYCNGWDTPTLEILIESIKGNNNFDGYLIIQGEDASGDIPDELWYHLEIARGIKVNQPPKYFSCSC